MRHLVPSILIIATVILSGCAATVPSDDAGTTGPSDASMLIGEPVIQDHDHGDAAAHALSANVDVLGRHNGWSDDGTFPPGAGGVNEIALWHDLVFVSRSGARGGFAILDFSSPGNAIMLGEFLSEPGADIEVSADGNWVFLASQRTTPSVENLQGKPATGNLHRGIYVVDVTDRSSPRFESFFALPTNGPHTVSYNCIGEIKDDACVGREILPVQTYDLVPNVATSDLLGAVPVTQRVFITEFTTLADGKRGLETRSVWSTLESPPAGSLFFPHDAVIQKHPLTGQSLMYVAYWDYGLVIVDVTDIAEPVVVSRFTEFRPTGLTALHYAEPFPVLVDGRHITAVAPEIVTAAEAGQLTFVDTTDPANPTYVGYWSVPGDLVVDSPFIFSPHNFDIRCAGGNGTDAGCRVAIGHNHAGAWEMDASSLAVMEKAPTRAFFMPVPEEGCRGRCVGVWGTMYREDGVLVVSDGGTGIWLVKTR